MPTTTGKATDFIQFSRAANATVVDSDGKIKWAPHNLLLASEQFDGASWTKGAQVTLTANAAAAPNGTTTAEKYSTSDGADSSLNNVLQQVATGPATLAAGVWLRAATNQTVTFTLLDNTTVITSQTLSVTSTWTLFTITGTVTTGTATLWRIRPNGTTAISNLEIWGAHLYRSDLGGMVANMSAYPMYNPTTPKNLLGYTESFDNAYWTKPGVSVTANSLVAPNGLTSADTLTAVAGASVHRLIPSVATVPSGTPCVHSVYLKAGTHSFAQIHDGASGSYFANFNLASGVAGTATGCTATMTSVGDGWYRCSIAMTLNVANPILCVALVTSASAARNESWTAAGTETIYLWGAQLSDSASLDPYVPNHFAAPSAAAYHGPRLDYDPVTLAPRGLLVEEQRTNLLLRSAEMDAAAWTKNSSTATGNAATAPDGKSTASLLVPTTTAAVTHTIYQSVTTTAVAHTLSVYVKAAGYTKVKVANLFTGSGVNFDVSAGTVGSASAGNTGTITSVGNGWYRCAITFTAAAETTLFGLYVQDASGNNVYAGDGTSGVYIWGFDLEAGSFATSYIPTTSASVTRSADVAQIGTAAFPFNEAEGTIIASGDFFAGSSTYDSFMFSIGNATETDRHKISRYLGGIYGGTLVSSAAQADISFGAVATNAVVKSAYAYKANDFAGTINGGSVATDTSGSVPTGLTAMRIGDKNNGNGSISGHIRQITYIPRRLSNAELVSRTSA